MSNTNRTQGEVSIVTANAQRSTTTAGFVRRWDLPAHITLVVLLFLALLPVAMLLIQAGKSGHQFDANPWGIMLPYHFDNYTRIAPAVTGYIKNTIIVSAVATGMAVMLASYSSYIFARFSFPGKEILFYSIIGLMMIPFVLSLVPQYMLVLRLQLTGTRWALIFPYAAGGAVFGVFLLRPFMASLPEELFEAARIDGAGEWQSYRWLAFPLSTPIMATLAILLVLGQWNDIIWASVVISDEELYTVSLGVWSIVRAYTEQTQWGIVFAGFTVTSMPIIILFIFTRNLFIRGLSSGALKV